MPRLTKRKQNKLILEEKEKILDVLCEVSEDKKDLAAGLIERLAFMSITLKELEEDIKTNGPTYLFE